MTTADFCGKFAMHERSLVASLLRQVESLCAEQGGQAIEEVRIEIGPLAGVEPLLVQGAFVEMASLSHLAGANLIIDNIPLTAHCRSCGVVDVSLSQIACSCCGSADVRIVAGDEVRLKSVTIRDGAETEKIQ
jgi:hydrogenase nickel incorporation protein HypA/HybF